jgi:hypothetical protein
MEREDSKDECTLKSPSIPGQSSAAFHFSNEYCKLPNGVSELDGKSWASWRGEVKVKITDASGRG